ncbi:hydrophobe/amphiphile efflux-1 (HAE1) family protein [Moraxella macacae 0408225]|uniref:Efflux pump membrane transporter n=1 Tax=Moraxella macacae 0408225 TaxID=1230338 RepID=L2F5G8_9GAMM|nr:efflux RND transporter permease subunit [Moraxella macacae]ELA08026.1 hydrophobe/amphiphile efflux-1 (HAE1) family protein [Moraxella macacae 0408225]
MSRYFIDRPIFAWVIAFIIMLAGVLSIFNLAIEQYPKIAPPTVSIRAVYPGASAKTIEDSVTQVIEQQMKGLDGLAYMDSTSSSAGSAQIKLTFENGINPDTAQVQVQNKLQSAMSALPETVQRMGVNVNKSSTGFLAAFAFVSEDGNMDRADIADYVSSNVIDQMSRVEGVGDITLWGAPYSMRIWLDPAKLKAYRLMPSDVAAAVRTQNTQVSAGQLGQMPTNSDRNVINATVSVQSYLQTPEQFRNILLKSNTDGSRVRLGDVATVELGSEHYSVTSTYNGKETAAMGISLAAGANALETRKAIQAKIDELSYNFPKGLKVVNPYDTTPFVRLSIEQVIKTLLEAIALVFVVMFVFLQSWRATVIPTLAVPVVILGAFAILLALGFSINILTMFALVLAIGLLVDDAIVVVENVERVLAENPHMTVKQATRQSMNEVSRAVIGIAVVLSAVFVPMAFFGGSTGVIYRQFSVTLITCMLLSAFVALVFTPALCATLLKRTKHHDVDKTGFFGWFNKSFNRISHGYENMVGKSIKAKSLYVIGYAMIIAMMGFFFTRIPSSFLPDEDQGIMIALVQLPAGSSQQQTQAVLNKVDNYFRDKEKDNVASVLAVNGFSFAGQGQNMGLAFIKLSDWKNRTSSEAKAQAIAKRAMGYFMTQVNEAAVYAIVPPAITELGNATGFNLQLQDQIGLGHDELLQARNMLLGMASQNKAVVGVRPNGLEDSPQYKININYDTAASMGVDPVVINSLLSTAWGSSYINDFMDRGRIKKVYMQGNPDSRTTSDDINKWYVRNTQGEMIPFSAFATGEWQYGSPSLTRYNSLSSMNIQGNAAMGLSSGDAMRAMEEMIAKLPEGIGFEWTGLSLEEKKSGDQAPILYALSLLIVFLCLAALYESWSIPFAVMLVVPLGVLGAVLLTSLRGFANDIYLQVGLLTVVGLCAKNAILIIEFAKERQEAGHSLFNAVTVAARQRLRPIIMTSLAFGMGVVPLFFATGPGSGSQTAIGTSVLGGVISSTLLGVFFIPMFYVWVRSIFKSKTINHSPQ